jgi:hypothetical protein
MLGKVRKKLIQSAPRLSASTEAIICPICDRAIPRLQQDAHHLIPKSKGGKATEYLHRICHRQIHALFNENELAKVLNTAQSLKEHPDMQKFITWVKTKPNHFYQRTSKSHRNV